MNIMNIDYPVQSRSDLAILVCSHLDAIRASELVRDGDAELVVFHCDHWTAAPVDVWPEMRTLDIDRPLGTPDTLPDQWWAIVRGSCRFDYRLIPLGDAGPEEWAAHGCRSGDRYVVESQKADVACAYECFSLLDALLTRGEHYHWTPVPTLADIIAI